MATKKDSIMNSIVSAVSRIFPDKKALSFGFFMLKSRASKSVAILQSTTDYCLTSKHSISPALMRSTSHPGIPRRGIPVTALLSPQTTVCQARQDGDQEATQRRRHRQGCQLKHNATGASSNDSFSA